MLRSKGDPGFCPVCGSILPLLDLSGNISCYTCKNSMNPESLGKMESEYTIHFNTFKPNALKQEKEANNEAEGPIIERKCPKCGNDKMSYATLQLRSADEGQTVFYTCTKCKFKESENS
ncbi:DNA-directed RNA polymerase I subunit RPA12 [Phlebotomus argentipes]|uniref:DNA-directed RNA polymerase I subunit RPA12 n=1 Tax=Phlebotomus argentipes TaxID=94469 RepID=UPI002892EC96|nr:DNA-directed RNA polymerase I subunit RPA12 [Phlebotomus argentipes]